LQRSRDVVRKVNNRRSLLYDRRAVKFLMIAGCLALQPAVAQPKDVVESVENHFIVRNDADRGKRQSLQSNASSAAWYPPFRSCLPHKVKGCSGGWTRAVALFD
jgi:hypothetical protein